MRSSRRWRSAEGICDGNAKCLDVPLELPVRRRQNTLRDRARRAWGLAYEAYLQEEDTRRLLAYAKELEDRAVLAERPDLFYATEARTASSSKK
jgi:hypothetical protein